MIQELLISNLITAVFTGTLSWLFTIKWKRKQEEATATESVQRIYQKIIEDLNADRARLQEQVAKFNDLLSQQNDKISSLENQVRRNENLFKAARPFVCAFAENCKDFKLKEISKI